MAATSATLEEAAASFRTSVETIRKKAGMLALPGRGATAEKVAYRPRDTISPTLNRLFQRRLILVRAATPARLQQQDSNPSKTGRPFPV
jgi:hypothetical protein